MVQLLLIGANKYYNHSLDTIVNDNRCSQHSDMTSEEINIFLAIITHTWHDVRDTLKYYWSTLDWLNSQFYSIVMKWENYFPILRYLHFCDNINQPDRTIWELYKRLRKLDLTSIDWISPMLQSVWILCSGWSHCCLQTVSFFKQCFSKKHKHFVGSNCNDPCLQSPLIGRSNPYASQIAHLDVWHCDHRSATELCLVYN
jgi:hypothetical protein